MQGPKKGTEFELTPTICDSTFQMNKNLARTAIFFSKLPLSEKQLVIICDAIIYATGYVPLTEGDTYRTQGTLKAFAPIAFGFSRCTFGQISLSKYAKQFSAMHFAFDEFCYFMWGIRKPDIVMIVYQVLTRFFQAQQIPPKLWNYGFFDVTNYFQFSSCTSYEKNCCRMFSSFKHRTSTQDTTEDHGQNTSQLQGYWSRNQGTRERLWQDRPWTRARTIWTLTQCCKLYNRTKMRQMINLQNAQYNQQLYWHTSPRRINVATSSGLKVTTHYCTR